MKPRLKEDIHKRISWLKRARIKLTPRLLLPRMKNLYMRAFIRDYFKTAAGEALLSHGKPFIETFALHPLAYGKWEVGIGRSTYESSVGVGIYPGRSTEEPIPVRRDSALVQAKLGFERKAVIIEALQGKRGNVKDVQRMNAALGMPWPNYLLQETEKHARACGFKKVKIRKPETLYYYKHPAVPVKTGEAPGPVIERVQARMRALYEKAAQAMGYHEEPGFYVKNL
ncbi:MAG: hypothetical protein HY393_03755 [Candidatus Diapherotrites archaeon]|nr:hypothetical protein [Candidatus Diapherotrites archaeon]